MSGQPVSMLQAWPAVLAFLAVAGCAASEPVAMHGPDGSLMHRIDCSGTARSWGACFQKAGDTCGARGYVVVHRSDERAGTPLIVGSEGGAISRVNDLVGSGKVARTMVIRCKPV